MSGASKKAAPRPQASSPHGATTAIATESSSNNNSSNTTTIPEEADPRPRDLESLVRILGASGRRLVECDGQWRILPRGDRRRRALMTVSRADVDRLRSEKLLAATPNGYVLAPDQSATIEQQPAAGPWVFAAACVPAAKGRWRGFARLAELARHGRGPLSLRQALAGLRLIEDAERAARDPMLTMNWDAVPADRNTRSGGPGGLQSHARRAAQRIARIRAALGKQDFAIVYAACIERVNLGTLEQRFGLKRLGVRKVLPEALEKAAEVYDG